MSNLNNESMLEKNVNSENIFSNFTPPKFTNIYKMYRLFLLCSITLHLILSILFFMCKFHNLAMYNIISSIVYILCVSSFKLKRMQVIFIIVNIELLCFISSCIIFLGWKYDFYLYYFLLMQLTLFSSISRKRDVYNLKLALVQFAIVSIVLIIIYAYAKHSDPTYIVTTSNTSLFNLIKTVNFVYISAMTFLLNFSFLADVNVANNRLTSTNDKLNYIATHDPLTDLINRRSMNEQLYLAIENFQKNREPFCLILADIDDFKKVNDVYGHDTGDIVLKRVSKIITDIVKEPNVVCRWGGEEILILIYGDLNSAAKTAEQIRESISATTFTLNNNYIHSTLTLGVAAYSPIMPIGKVISIADENLYKGKKGTKNCVVV